MGNSAFVTKGIYPAAPEPASTRLVNRRVPPMSDQPNHRAALDAGSPFPQEAGGVGPARVSAGRGASSSLSRS